jgi:hypothetical protein
MFGNSVYIKKSTICNGYGIFAKRKISKNEIITWYYGKIINEKNKKQNDKYIIQYGLDNDNMCISGISEIEKITYGKGIAQLANDAICYDLTYRNNNSYFLQKGRYILLKSLETINKDVEILVSYGINYWVGEITNYPNNYNLKFKNTIKILADLINIIETFCKCDIYEYKGIFDDYKIMFSLQLKKRWCIYSNNIHKNDDFYITLKWNETNNNILEMYYVCKTCDILEFDILIKEFENGFIVE